MSLTHNIPRLNTDGLILYLDAANPKSYPGSGDNWFDLTNTSRSISRNSSNAEHEQLGGALCFNFKGYSRFLGTNFYSSNPHNGNNLTIEAWINPSSSILGTDTYATILVGTSPNSVYMSYSKNGAKKLASYWYGKSPAGYHQTGDVIPSNTWSYVASVWDTGILYQYLNEEKTSVSTSGTSATALSSINIGAESNGRQFLGGISLVRIYSRSLSELEILSNYKSMKPRFNL